MKSRKTWLGFGCLAVCVLTLAAGRECHTRFIVPVMQREEAASRAVAGFMERIADAQQTIADIRAQQDDMKRAASDLERLEDELPAGTATGAIPTLVKEHFAGFGIPVPLLRLNATEEAADLPGCVHGYWSVALPIDEAGKNVTTLLQAVSALDELNPFVRVLDFSIRPDPENPQGRVGSLNVGALVRK